MSSLENLLMLFGIRPFIQYAQSNKSKDKSVFENKIKKGINDIQ